MEHDRKDYGYNSKLGATFVLSADTGEVLDYGIKSTYCNVSNVSTIKMMTLIAKNIRIGRKIIIVTLITMVQLKTWKKIQLPNCFVDWSKNITCDTQSILVVAILVLLAK